MAYSREQFYRNANTPGLEERIYALGQTTGLGANFHERQMWKESSGRTGIAGDQGQSIGLGQIYDPTWKMLQAKNSSLMDRTDPFQNVQAQEDLWKMNLATHQGDQYAALRAYNGSGPMAEKYAQSLAGYLPGGGRYENITQMEKQASVPAAIAEETVAPKKKVKARRASTNQFSQLNAILSQVNQRSQALMNQKIDINRMANFR